MHEEILPNVIFSPAELAIALAEGLQRLGVEITLFSPGRVQTNVPNHTADLTYFERELAERGDSYLDLLKKHPLTYVTLARQVQSELIAEAYAMANDDKLDIVHIYTNEEDLALPFAKLCRKPVIFTHHDPFNFSVKYKNVFPKYTNLNWVSLSYAQRSGMPPETNWIGNVYHGLTSNHGRPIEEPTNDYVAFLGRIIQPKGVHLAIQAVQQYNDQSQQPIRLKIAGKHYAGHTKDTYWQSQIVPLLDDPYIEYVGFISPIERHAFLGNARALIMPSLFDEPFGMVSIESLASGTPVIGLDSGAIPEVITDGETGSIVQKVYDLDGSIDEPKTVDGITNAIARIGAINRLDCYREFETRFTSERMCTEYLKLYNQLTR